MEYSEPIAPAVRSILDSARRRGTAGDRVSVDARSLVESFDRVRQDGRMPVLAEIKPTSPTTAGVREDDPVELAREMVAGGAAALSVLTEPDHFGGRPADLRGVREAVDVPVVRKDFVLHEQQLDTVRADAVLLIARFVDDLDALVGATQDRGFQVIVEVHTPEEVERAVTTDAEVVGVNNRDLSELSVDLGTFERLAPEVPDDRTLIGESGIERPVDVRRMERAGADGVLVGSAIMEGDVRANTRQLVAATRENGGGEGR